MDTFGAKAGEEGGDIAGVRWGESFEGVAMVDLETKQFGGDRVGFGVVKEDQWMRNFRLSCASLSPLSIAPPTIGQQ